MEQFIQGFIDESLQLIENLDTLLIDLNVEAYSEENIQEIFRIMHTIKGSAAMFAFSNTENITHCLEDVYDLIRCGDQNLTTEILNITLKVSDLLKILLVNKDNITTELQNDYDNALLQIHKFTSASSNSVENNEGLENYELENNPQFATYYIWFKPDNDVMKRGLSVHHVFDDLENLGEFKGIPILDAVPLPKDYEPTEFFIAWDLFIRSNASMEEIQDSFLFYLSHEYQVIRIDNNDLSSVPKFIECCMSINNNTKSVDDLQKILNLLTKIPGEKETKIEEVNADQKTDNPSILNTIKVNSNKLDDLVNLVSDLVTFNSQLENISNKYDDELLKKTIKSISKLSKKFRDTALELRLIPIKTLELKMQRLIFDLSNSLNKPIEFLVEGTNTELDKNIIARLEGPIIHILRNSIDHGLELPDERIELNKPTKGVIRFVAFYSGSNVFIQIQDDGRGIDPEIIRLKAIEKGFIAKDKIIEKHEIFNLLFKAGFSTSDKVTNISGRGVGLDVVRNEIMSMRGEIDIESEIGLGTSFTIKLPLTLSIIDTLMCTVGETCILIPKETIVHTMVSWSANKVSDKMEYKGELIPVITLSDELFEDTYTNEKYSFVIVAQNDKHYALIVSRILGEHQAVVKPLGYYNSNHDYFSSASVLGDGNLALILDIAKLINNKRSKSNLGKYNLK